MQLLRLVLLIVFLVCITLITVSDTENKSRTILTVGIVLTLLYGFTCASIGFNPFA